MKHLGKAFFLSILLLILIHTFVVLTFSPLTFVFQFLSLLLLLFLPGFLTLLYLKAQFEHTLVYIINSLGLSIVWIYIMGLFSVSLPYIGIPRPLDTNPIIFLLSGVNIILLGTATFRHWNTNIDKKTLYPLLTELGGYLATIALATISIAGAFYLNNGQSNVFILIWLSIVIISFLILSILKTRNFSDFYPYYIFLLGLSLLWSLSSRSFTISGWDIIQEFLVAKNTQTLAVWEMNSIKDAYNACISINILPTIISNTSSTSIEFIFKFVYPFLFAHFTVILYFLIKKLTNSKIALFSSFYIIAQSFFIQPMVALARQEIAFFFFSLLLLSIYSDEIKGKIKVIITTIYIFALVTSHYSTTYISVVLLSLVYSMIFCLQIIRYIPMPKLVKNLEVYKTWIRNFRSPLRLWIVLTLIIFTYTWYFVVTKTGWDVEQLVQENISNIPQLFEGKQKSQEVQQAISGQQTTIGTSQDDLQNYIDINNLGLKNLSKDKINELSTKYPLIAYSETIIQPSISFKLARIISTVLGLLKNSLKYSLILCSVLLFLKTFLKSKPNLDLVLFSSISTLLILIMLLHPTLGVRYNISRISLQLLAFLSGSLFVIFDTILSRLNNRIKDMLISTCLIILLFYLHGLLTPLIGGVPSMVLYNKGTDYEKFYIFESELKSAEWLQNHRNPQNTVYGDDFSGLRIRKAAGFFPNTTVLPAVFENNKLAYVFLSHTNKILHKSQINFSSKFLTYKYPEEYLSENRNLIYSNKKSEIYK